MVTATLLAAVLVIVWGSGQLLLRHLVESFVLADLEHDAQTLAQAWSAGRGLDVTKLAPVYLEPGSGHYYLVAQAGQEFASPSLGDGVLELTDSGGTRADRLRGPQGEHLLALTTREARPGGVLRITVAEPLDHLEEELDRSLLLFAALAAGVLLVLLVTSSWLVARSFRALAPVRAGIRALTRDDQPRLDIDDAPLEVQPLVEEINRLLASTEARLLRSRTAVADLAHALKTPLTLLVQTLDSLDESRDETRDKNRGEIRNETPDGARNAQLDTEARARLAGAVKRIQQRIDAELRRARFAGAGHGAPRSDPAADLPDLVRVIERLHGPDLRIDLGALPDTDLPVDREDFLELVGNLLDNAGRFARTRVRVTLERGPCGAANVQGWILRVEDDGPGLAVEDRTRLLERGVRGDTAQPGHGLGLAIVVDGMRMYGGTLDLDASPDLGGLRATLRFPDPE